MKQISDYTYNKLLTQIEQAEMENNRLEIEQKVMQEKIEKGELS